MSKEEQIDIHRIVTIATFDNPLQAHMARNALEAAGIVAVLEDEHLSTTNWILTNAIHAIKLRVSEPDAVIARKVLEDKSPAEFPDQPHEEVMDPHDYFEDDEDESESSPAAEPYDDRLTQREQDADRAFRAAVLGLLLVPLQFYAAWLLVRVFFSNERLQSRHARQVMVAALINIPFVVIGLMIIRAVIFG